MYSNDLYHQVEIANVTLTEEVKALILGGETCMWSEQVSKKNI